VFLITGMSIGGTGTFAGFLLGLVFTANIQRIQEFVSWMLNRQLWDPTLRFLSQVPAEVDPGEVAAIVAMSLVLSFLATLYPAWRASRIDPVEALRYG
jgi:lipoprotein-releasing system permease protein